jgi:hypothetical protein
VREHHRGDLPRQIAASPFRRNGHVGTLACRDSVETCGPSLSSRSPRAVAAARVRAST